ncbi:sensor histidine kinase [Spirosoma sp. KUDC1026]|uniref:sensor histidine kinase n=1 Tax=Spirosoma sp. KUDC1026 TaxID=2745947 RepID=UPI00159BC91E|nr:ATP-binding protein [Spirosoma sp. KUDC1026]QKZ11145.1 PAS domain-containing protein [Spirosoma sp. KUDC1026]
MKLPLRTSYLIYIIAVHLVLVALTWLVLREDKVWFIVSELLILASIYLAIRIYQAFREPSEFIESGIEAIKDQDFTVKFVPTGNYEVDALINVYNLMIDQLRQERIRQVEQRFFLDKLIEAAPIAILIFDYDERIADANPKALQLLQHPLDSLLTKTLTEVSHPLFHSLNDKTLPAGETRTVKTNGMETYRLLRGQFMDRGFVRKFLLIEELTTEIVETEKKAYGKVIRMMAHEVNNSIGAINSILTITESELTDPDLQQAVGVAIDRNDRLNQFMRRFADVVRLPTPSRMPTDVVELTRNVMQLMRPQADEKGVTITFTAAENVTVALDAGQIEQVLVNVIKNALEACEPGNQVVVQVTDQELSVRNDGKPIPAASAEQLFNPFYSNKPTGQGIGLTLTREILLNHDFAFSLQTENDGWTAFRINYISMPSVSL